ncbi:DUF6602 domain-containing protein [Peptostreptococcus canis]|uniref:DUF6602 domain-containing protein n=1 Tax=Peptostreptococcus canis TaxID=1159213 RepID=A0ABR6TLJ2_9FIRM|nr:DUF6602 domain-containing protein [Peptostreptococcus canis]MBC2576274.1 hypothetical protein [Peptostreptococcus canis]MBP1998189.1 hypothetical protein [Peptostreptococcus canis]
MNNDNKDKEDKYKHISNIKRNYRKMEEELITQLNYVTSHGVTLGSNREYVWKSLFERIIPKKFNIDRSVFIMDSYGNISKEVDLAIYDEQYTPYIFRYGTIKFIPVEAVAAVIECKSILKYDSNTKDTLSNWVKSITMLNTGLNSLVRINTGIHDGINLEELNEKSRITQTSTTPIKILCHMGSYKNEDEKFDIVIKASKENLEIEYNSDYTNLLDWYLHLNHYNDLNDEKSCNKEMENLKDKREKIQEYIEIEKMASKAGYDKLKKNNLETYKISDNNILSFIFQFNQLLMLINNPLFFPHMDYVNMFNKYEEKDE